MAHLPKPFPEVLRSDRASDPDSADGVEVHAGRGLFDGVVNVGSRQVLVSGAIVGERVRIGPVRREGNAWRAPLLAVLSPSPDRAADACADLLRCGGCPLGHVRRPAQLERKASALQDALGRAGVRVESARFKCEAPEPGRGYRTRTRLAWLKGERETEVGYRPLRSRDIVVPARCVVIEPIVETARLEITRLLGPHLVGSGRIHLAASQTSSGERAVVARLESEAPQSTRVFRTVEDLAKGGVLAGARLRFGGASVDVEIGDATERSADVDGRLLEAPAGSFRQAHLAAARVLGQAVLGAARPEGASVLELFAGHGHFTLALASRARRTLAVELDAAAVAALRANAEAHRVPVEARAADAAAALTEVARTFERRPSTPRFDVVVLDPPRGGALACIAPIASIAPSRLVYVSCDVESFSRDAHRMATAGFELSEITLFDLFPDTAHIEIVALFERTGRSGARAASPARTRRRS